MPAGAKAWDPSGNVTFTASTRTARVIGMIPLTGDSTLHWFDVPKESGEKLFVHLTVTGSGTATAQARVGDGFASDSDSNRIWYYLESGTTGFLLYGIYY